MRFGEPMLPDTTMSVLRPMPMSTGSLPSATRCAFHVLQRADHRDRGAHRAVGVVVVRDREAEGRP